MLQVCPPEVLDVVLQFLQLEKVPHGEAVEEGLCGGAPVDVWGGGGGGGGVIMILCAD